MRKNNGQSLVEIAIAMPLLLIILLGLFEVGWAIRDKMILDTAAGSGARYAVKPHVLVISGTQVSGYQAVISQTLTTMADQLRLADTDAVIVSVAAVDTGQPCDPALRADPVQVGPGTWDYWPNCDCASLSATTTYTPYVVLSPAAPGYTDWQYRWPLTTTRASRVDFGRLVEYAEVNDRQNCAVMKTGATVTASQDRRVTVEIFYDHRQLLGAPLLSNYLTDPIPMHSWATFRIVESRE